MSSECLTSDSSVKLPIYVSSGTLNITDSVNAKVLVKSCENTLLCEL